LEAVNTLLDIIGESPVSTLEDTGLADVAKARRTLKETSREVQSRGWHFNTEENYSLPRDDSNQIFVPPNTLRVDTTKEFYQYDVVQRGQRLYDRKNHTYSFDKTLKVNLLVFLDFEELPEAARNYITIRAARKFNDRELTDQATHVYSEDDEDIALATLKEAEGDTGDYNMFNGSYSVASILER
jgi:hypothetical protein